LEEKALGLLEKYFFSRTTFRLQGQEIEKTRFGISHAAEELYGELLLPFRGF